MTNPLLSAIAKQFIQNPNPSLADQNADGTAYVLLALSSTDSEAIAQHLLEAQQAGINLRQVGSLALYANQKAVADVLSADFNIKPHHYRTLGDEAGIDAQPNYPTLAMAAYLKKTQLQRRALEWGADPNASWTIQRRMGEYDRSKKTGKISWISENVLSLNSDFLEELLPKSNSLVPRPEQMRRMDALKNSVIRFNSSFSSRYKTILNWFKPGGAFALDVSPWDVSMDRSDLPAIHGLSDRPSAAAWRYSRQFDSGAFDDIGRTRQAMNAWIESTVPDDNTSHLDCLLLCVSRRSFAAPLPNWCIDRLTPPQAQLVIQEFWKQVMPDWIKSMGDRTISVFTQKSTNAEVVLRDYTRPIDAITKIATSEPCAIPFSGPRFLLAQVPMKDLVRFSGETLEALVQACPKFKGQNNDDQVSDVREIFTQFDAYREGLKDQYGNIQRNAGVEKFQPMLELVHKKLNLEVAAAKARPTTSIPSASKPKF